MSRYIGKRVSYECGFCKKQFTLNKKSVDDSEESGEVFCSKQCSEQFYLSDVRLSLPSKEDIREPIQSALYATGHFLTDECTEIADGILTYLNDYGFKVVRQ